MHSLVTRSCLDITCFFNVTILDGITIVPLSRGVDLFKIVGVPPLPSGDPGITPGKYLQLYFVVGEF